MYPKINLVQYFERCRKCEANGSGPLFKCGVAKHLKDSTHDCKVTGNERFLCSHMGLGLIARTKRNLGLIYENNSIP